ncbi:MAG: M56 family metallopeptidase [Planctomycetota bacterium]
MTLAHSFLVYVTIAVTFAVGLAALLAYLFRHHSASTKSFAWQLVVPMTWLCVSAGLMPSGIEVLPDILADPSPARGDGESLTVAPGAVSESSPSAGFQPLPRGNAPSPRLLGRATAEARIAPQLAMKSNDPNSTQVGETTTLPQGASRQPLDVRKAIGVCITAIWIGGIAFCMVRLVVSAYRLRKMVSNAHRIELEDNTLLAMTRSLIDRTMQSDQLMFPCVVGMHRPTLLLPSEFESWPLAHQRMAISHECEHVNRRDLVWQRLFQWSCCIAWFHPLIWVAQRRYFIEREMACDDRVIRDGDEPAALAEFLMVLLRPENTSSSMPLISMAAPPIRQRVLSIMDSEREHCRLQQRTYFALLVSSTAMSLALGLARFPSAGNSVLAQSPFSQVDTSPRNETDGLPFDQGFVELTVTDDSGQSISDAEVHVFGWTGGSSLSRVLDTKRTDQDGASSLDDLPVDQMLYVYVKSPGYALASMELVFAKPAKRRLTMKMSRPVKSYIELRDPEGNPIEGATLEGIRYTSQHGSRGYLSKHLPGELGVQINQSDESGRIDLPALPSHATISASIVHPKWTRLVVPKTEIVDGLLSSYTMSAGCRLRINMKTADGRPIDDGVPVTVHLQGEFRQHSQNRELVTSQGGIEIIVPPSNYQVLSVRSDYRFIGPTVYNLPGQSDSQINLQDKSNAKIDLGCWEKRAIHGKVINRRGEAVSGAMITVIGGSAEQEDEIREFLGGEQANSIRVLGQLRSVEMATSFEDGTFTTYAADGVALVSAEKEGLVANPASLTCMIDGEAIDLDRPLMLESIRKLSGFVTRSNGTPVSNALVWFDESSQVHREVCKTNDKGAFELSLPGSSAAVDESAAIKRIIALDPGSSDAGTLMLDTSDDLTSKTIQVRLQPESADWMASPARSELKAKMDSLDSKAREEWNAYAKKSREMYSDGLPGEPVPDMKEGKWINTDATSLSDLRGRFVLLDFWFVGCGPCIQEIPTLKLIHDTFSTDQLTIVGMHTNSQTPQAVEAYLGEKGIEYPVVVDDARGAITESYASLGVSSFPSYILIDPNGKIVRNSSVHDESGDSLRSDKIQLIRHAILKWDWGSQHSQEPAN